jgi:hypothetical protein
VTSDARFTRHIEDFACGNCASNVAGDGYTNHCPQCLWSRHVDVHPGDRAATCGALMEPIGIEQRKNEWRIVHRCVTCGHRKANRLAELDDADAVRALATQPLFDA